MRAAAAVIRGVFVVVILLGPLVAGAAEAGFDILVSASLVRCGAQARALFTTIQDGVNAAGPGERVGVCPGTYVEEVVVGTAGITIQGIGVVQVVAPAGPGPKSGFTVTADRVTITRFGVSGFTGDNDSCGIAVNGAAGVTVENNRVHDNAVGICLLSTDRGRVRNNVVTANGGADFGGGIRVRFGTGNTVTGNTVRANVWEGIVDEAATSTSIHHNLSADNVMTGIILNTSEHPAVANNTLRDNSNGVVAGFTTGAVIEHNVATGNGAGVHVFTSSGCVVRRNAAPLNGDGISLRDVSSCAVSWNQAHRNRQDGIAGQDLGAGNVFERNSASHNARFDCNWDLSDTPTFIGNACGTENPPGVW